MFKDKIIQKGVTSSIIASILVTTFISPILDFFWGFVLNYGENWITSFSSKVYSNAAYGKRNWIDTILAMYFFSALIGFFIFANSYVYKKYQKVESLLKDKEKGNVKKIEKVENLKSLTKRFKYIKPVLIFNWCISAYFIFSSFQTLFLVYADLQLNTSFEQRLNAILPYINDQEEEELKSNWALMVNRTDYEKINMKFEKHALDNNITLPNLLLK